VRCARLQSCDGVTSNCQLGQQLLPNCARHSTG
jgi:hypothetical protein